MEGNGYHGRAAKELERLKHGTALGLIITSRILVERFTMNLYEMVDQAQ